jgi:regulator of RNase E activity RraA
MKDLVRHAMTLGVGVGQISDAMDELGLPQNAGGGYRRLGGQEGAVFGPAFPIRQIALGPGQTGTTRQGEAALELAAPGDILVIDAAGMADVVTWGEAHSLRAQINGLAGVVLHGATRDSDALKTSDLTILHRGTSPLRSKGRLQTFSVGEPVNIAGITVRQGDLLVMDSDGVVCIAREQEAEVLMKACEIQSNELERDDELRARRDRALGS